MPSDPSMHTSVPASAPAEPTGGTDVIWIWHCHPGSTVRVHNKKFWLALQVFV